MRTIDDAFSVNWNKPFPRAVQIETVSACNAKCSYCPYSDAKKYFVQERMSDALFEKIVNELAQWSPQLVAPYLNNEPLLDNNMIPRIKHLRLELPDAYLDFSTNASLITEHHARFLTSSYLSLSEIKINIPSTEKEEYEKTTGLSFEKAINGAKLLKKYAENQDFKGMMRVVMVGGGNEKDEEFWKKLGIPCKEYTLVSRAGSIENGFEPLQEVNGCRYNRQKEWMHICSNGDVILCCMDFYRTIKLGNIKNESLYDVWNSKAYEQVRKTITKSTDKDFLCNKCEWGIQ